MLKFTNIRIGVNAFTSSKNDTFLPLLWNIPSRNMTSRKFRIKKDKPPPFPYETKKYNWWRSMFDHTFTRFDENSKLIIIEGPVGSGKHKLAKHLAEEFEMKYMGDITTDIMYINDYGYDMRNLDPKLPEAAQSYDEKRFLREPTHFLSAVFHFTKYRLRYAHYFDALAHIMNTGQGVILVRSPYSTSVFTHAMRECKFITEQANSAYKQLLRHTIHFLIRPHMIIYLDVSVQNTIANIKKRNRPEEQNTLVYQPKYFQAMEDFYKRIYLKEASIHSKMLIYDWAEEGDPEIVVEDIERVDFEKHTHPRDLKLEDWRLEEYEMDFLRVRYSAQKVEHMCYFPQIHSYECPELWLPGGDLEVWEKVWFSAPGMEYAKGYNIKRGDKNVWFKTKHYKEWEPLC